MVDKDLEDIQEMINQHNKELEEEYQELLSKIKSGNATADDYISAAANMELIYKNPDKQQWKEFLETGARMAQKNLSSSNIEERIIAFATLASYYEHKKNYKEALKCYDAAIDAGGKEYLVLRAHLRVNYLNDRKGANKDYELAVQAGLPEEELHLFEILVKNQKTFSEKLPTWLMIAFVIIASIALAIVDIFLGD